MIGKGLFQLVLTRGSTATNQCTIILYVAMLRLLAIGLLSGVAVLPLIRLQRGENFEHARLAALTALDAGQVITVPPALLVGIVLTATRSWTRTPGYTLGSITTLFGVVVATQAWAAMNWVEGRPSGIGDPDGEFVVAVVALLSGVITTLVGALVLLFRWTGYESQTASSRRQRSARLRG